MGFVHALKQGTLGNRFQGASMKQQGVLLACILAICVQSVSATSSGERAASSIAQENQRDYAQQANSQRLRSVLERAVFSTNYDSIEQELGPLFGGLWLDGSKYVIALKGATDAALVIADTPGFRVVSVRFNFQQLRMLQEALMYRYIVDPVRLNQKQTVPINNTSIDVRNNAVVVSGDEKNLELIRDALQAAGYDMEMLRFEVGSRPVPA